VADSLPAKAAFVRGTRGAQLKQGRVVWPALKTLAVNASASDTVWVSLPAAGTYVNAASATAKNMDPDPSNNDGSDESARVSTVVEEVDLAIAKRMTSELITGDIAVFELQVSNVGVIPTSGPITVVDSLPASLGLESVTGDGWTCTTSGPNGSVVTCTNPGPLQPGSSSTITLSALVAGAPGVQVVNRASVNTLGDSESTNNAAATASTPIQQVGRLELEKRASVGAAEIGDLVHYDLILRNIGIGGVANAQIEDRLPAGFTLILGSVVVDGQTVADPIGAPGPVLTFEVGTVSAGAEVKVSYALRVGVGAELGDGVNRAQATGSNGQAQSNAVAAAVALRRGVFTDEGLILGRVWVGVTDSTTWRRDADEERLGAPVGVAGVRVYLNDGTSALTDAEGRYSFEGLQPRHWIVRVDERTLPEGMELRSLTARHLGEGSSKLVDLTKGELARADFADNRADTVLIRRTLDRAAIGPVPDIALPNRLAARSAGSLNRGPDAWRQGAAVQRVATTTPLFRRTGSTSGMALDPGANRNGGSAAAVGPRSSGSAATAGVQERLGMLLSGFIEGRIDWRSLSDGELFTSGVRDRFQDALIEIATSNDDGTRTMGARATAFATGEIGDGWDVTLRLDTEKNRGARLFNDIRPDDLYDVFGDASPNLFEAQSKGRVFGALAKGDSYLMYGDFNTATYDPAQLLGRYSRVLNGAMQQYATENVAVRTFASRDRFQQVVDELPALGVSGPYALSRGDGLINSERVEIITRDRNQPAVIVDVTPMERFTDYTVEPFTGRLVFKKPVASVDEHLNPMSIRVTYESERGGDAFWVYGGDARLGVGDRLSLGAGIARSDDPNGRYDLASANATLALTNKTLLTGEVARSDSAGVEAGDAYRIELRHTGERVDLRGFYQTSDSTFNNASAGVGVGRTEMGAIGRALLTDKTSLVGEALKSTNERNDASVTGVRVALARKIGERWSAQVGYRGASEDGQARGQNGDNLGNAVNALGLRLSGQMSERSSIFVEAEQDIEDGDAQRLAIGGDVRLLRGARFYAQHELISSLNGPYSLNERHDRNTTVFGLSADYREGQSVFSEYRAGNRLNGREAHAAIGLRNQWAVSDGTRLHTSLERVSPMGSSESGTAFAITGALEVTGSPLWKGSLRGELRTSDREDRAFGTFGFARRLSDNVTLLAQSAVSKVLDGGSLFERTRVGLAYRGTDRTDWNMLARYEHRTDNDPLAVGAPREHSAHVLASHVNLRPLERFTARGQWAAKFATDRVGTAQVSQSTQLVAGRGTFDVTDGIDLGGIGRVMFGEGDRQYGLGIEAGLRLSQSLRLGVGYNWFGFSDEDLALDEYTDRGFFIDLGWAFDETLFGLGAEDDARQGENPHR